MRYLALLAFMLTALDDAHASTRRRFTGQPGQYRERVAPRGAADTQNRVYSVQVKLKKQDGPQPQTTPPAAAPNGPQGQQGDEHAKTIEKNLKMLHHSAEDFNCPQSVKQSPEAQGTLSHGGPSQGRPQGQGGQEETLTFVVVMVNAFHIESFRAIATKEAVCKDLKGAECKSVRVREGGEAQPESTASGGQCADPANPVAANILRNKQPQN